MLHDLNIPAKTRLLPVCLETAPVDVFNHLHGRINFEKPYPPCKDLLANPCDEMPTGGLCPPVGISSQKGSHMKNHVDGSSSEDEKRVSLFPGSLSMCETEAKNKKFSLSRHRGLIFAPPMAHNTCGNNHFVSSAVVFDQGKWYPFTKA